MDRSSFGYLRLRFAPRHVPGGVRLNGTLAGEHNFLYVVAAGSAAAAYAAVRDEVESHVLVEVVPTELVTSAEVVGGAFRAALNASALGHGAIAKVRASGDLDDGGHWIRFEPLVGRTLASRLEQDGPLTPTASGVIVARASDAVAAATEAGISHETPTTEDIFLQHDDPARAVILGLGLPRLAKRGQRVSISRQSARTPSASSGRFSA